MPAHTNDATALQVSIASPLKRASNGLAGQQQTLARHDSRAASPVLDKGSTRIRDLHL